MGRYWFLLPPWHGWYREDCSGKRLGHLDAVKGLHEAAGWTDKFNGKFVGKGPKQFRFVNSGRAHCDCHTDHGWVGVAQVEEQFEGDFKKLTKQWPGQ